MLQLLKPVLVSMIDQFVSIKKARNRRTKEAVHNGRAVSVRIHRRDCKAIAEQIVAAS